MSDNTDRARESMTRALRQVLDKDWCGLYSTLLDIEGRWEREIEEISIERDEARAVAEYYVDKYDKVGVYYDFIPYQQPCCCQRCCPPPYTITYL
jgi:hypothetical protein